MFKGAFGFSFLLSIQDLYKSTSISKLSTKPADPLFIFTYLGNLRAVISWQKKKKTISNMFP